MDLGLSGKVVLITGASGGIGQALADGFAAAGARLVLHAHTNADALARHARAGAHVITCDVADAAALDRAVDDAVAAVGRLDVCVANAGIWPPEAVPLHELDERRIRRVLETNLFGAMFTARAFLRALARTGPRRDGHGASLAFIGSTAGRFGERGHAEYAVSKAGLHGLVRTLKNEIVALDPYARVNLVEPGWTVTPMARPALADPAVIERALATMPLRQLARPVDVANAVLFLASPTMSRHVSGEVLTVAGGMEGRRQWEPGEVGTAAVLRRLDDE